MRVCQLRDDITLANIALVLIHQTDYLLQKLLEKYKTEFLNNGGVKEQMSAARRQWRQEHGMGYLNGTPRNNESHGNYGNTGNHGDNAHTTDTSIPPKNNH